MEKVYLINRNWYNTASYEDHEDGDEIVAAFRHKEDAINFVSDFIFLWDFAKDYVDESKYPEAKVEISDYKYTFEMLEPETSLLCFDKYLMGFNEKGEFDKNPDRNNENNWHEFWDMSVTNFKFSIKEMEVR